MKVILNGRILRFALLCCFFSVVTSQTLLAQKNKKGLSTDDCQLDEAKKWYEEGDLEKIEEIEGCVNNPKSMSREKRIEALQLLTESYLYRDKIGAADKTFRNLLRADPLYEADSTNSKVSYDLIYLSRTFSRRPIFSMYFGAGANFSLVQMLQNYGVDNTSGIADHEGYLSKVVLGGTFDVGFEIPLIYNFELAFGLTFAYRTFVFSDSLYMSVNPSNPAGGTSSTLGTGRTGVPLLYSTVDYKEHQFWLDVPLMVRYNIPAFKNFLPYIYVGASANFLLYANMGSIERSSASETTGGGEVIQPPIKPIDLTAHPDPRREDGTMIPSLRTQVNVSLVVGAGAKIRVGRNFIYADFRYNRMFLNNVNPNNRYANPDLLYNYLHVDNDFRMDNFVLTLGFIKSFYVPRKKHQHNPLVIGNKYNRWLEKERNYAKKETDEDLKRELNSAIKEYEKEKPSLIEDVQKGKSKGSKMIEDRQKELDDIKNKRVKVEVKYE